MTAQCVTPGATDNCVEATEGLVKEVWAGGCLLASQDSGFWVKRAAGNLLANQSCEVADESGLGRWLRQTPLDVLRTTLPTLAQPNKL